MTNSQVFITGRSLISCLGPNEFQSIEAMAAARANFQSLENLPVGLLTEETREAIHNLDQDPLTRGHDRVTKLAVLAARQLAESAGPVPSEYGCIVGSSRGATHSLEKAIEGFSRHESVDAKTSPITTANSLPSTVSKALNLTGLHVALSAACSTGLHAVGMGFAMMKAGILDGAIVGGAECAVTPFTLAILNRARVYSRFTAQDPWPHRPLHPDRNGMVLADGACLLRLERQAHGPCVEVLAFSGCSESKGLTGVSSDGEALQGAIRQVLNLADLKSENIDLIVGHGASTKKGDEAEFACYQAIFGEHRPPIVFHKHLTGHTLGAAGSISVSLGTFHLLSNSLFEHPYLSELDQENAQRRREKLQTVLIVSLGFGGNAAAMILRRVR
ncbi:MAG: beta-ketoacyl synthase N-terminal-like domain-containing protein [Oligoflexus sp.]